MVENVANNGLEVLSSNTEDFVQKGFSVEANPVIFSILSQSLYKNPLEAVIRELSSNALDAHIAAGIENTVPIEINLPTALTPYIEVIDHGVGMSGDFILNSFSSFGTSTKRDKDSKAIGGFGIGAKSPFAISTSFTITSVHKGKRSSFLCTKEGLAPSILCLEMDVPCAEGQGTTIRIDGLNKEINHNSVSERLGVLIALFALYPVQPIINYPVKDTSKFVKLCKGFYAAYVPTHTCRFPSQGVFLKLGASYIPIVKYFSSLTNLPTVLDSFPKNICNNIRFFLDIDPLIVPVTPSREDYIQTAQANEFIDSEIKRVETELKAKYSQDGWLPLLDILSSLGEKRRCAGTYDATVSHLYNDTRSVENVKSVNSVIEVSSRPIPHQSEFIEKRCLYTGFRIYSQRRCQDTQPAGNFSVFTSSVRRPVKYGERREHFIPITLDYYVVPKEGVLTTRKTLKVNGEEYTIDPTLPRDETRVLLNTHSDAITVMEELCGIEISYPLGVNDKEEKWEYLKKAYPNIKFDFCDVYTEKAVRTKTITPTKDTPTPCRRYTVSYNHEVLHPFVLTPNVPVTVDSFLESWNSSTSTHRRMCVFLNEGEVLKDIITIAAPYLCNIVDNRKHLIWVVRNKEAKKRLLKDEGFLQDATRTGRLFIQDIKAHEYSWDKFSQYTGETESKLKKVFLVDAVLNELQKSDWFSLKFLYTKHLTNRELHFLPELSELTKLIEDNPTIKEAFLFHGQTGRGDTWEKRWSFPKELIIELTADVIDYYQCKMEPLIKKAAYLYKDKTELNMPPEDAVHLFKGYSESNQLKQRRLTYEN